jgi:hypothetical protein
MFDTVLNECYYFLFRHLKVFIHFYLVNAVCLRAFV